MTQSTLLTFLKSNGHLSVVVYMYAGLSSFHGYQAPDTAVVPVPQEKEVPFLPPTLTLALIKPHNFQSHA